MSIKLAFLGTGTCNSTTRNPPSLALSDGKDVVLIDCGGGCYHQLSRLGDKDFRYDTISTILLTHFHLDHVSGLADILWGEMWDTRGPRNKPITIAGPPGLTHYIKDSVLPLIGNHSIPFEIHTIDIAPGDIFKGTFFSALSYKTAHTDTSSGYLFNTGSKKLAITGDTGFCDNLVQLLSGSDIAVMEWSKSDRSENSAHITRTDIERLLKLGVFPPKTYFTHLYLPHDRSFEEQVRLNRKVLYGHKGLFYFPNDLEVITIE